NPIITPARAAVATRTTRVIFGLHARCHNNTDRPASIRCRYHWPSASCPLCPRKRTLAVHKLMSALGQKRTLHDVQADVRRSRPDMAEFKNKRPPQLAAFIPDKKSKFAITRDP